MMRRTGLLTLALLAAPAAAYAANANNPYGNVDRRVDAGNDTGDSRVEQLNQAQLQGGPSTRAQGSAPRGYGYAAQMPGYAAPGYAAPVYAAPVYSPYYSPYYVARPFAVTPRPYYYAW